MWEGHTWRIIPVSKWLITMVIVSPLNSVVPLPNGLNGLNGLYMGVTNYLLTGMILQVQRPNMEAENDGFQDWFIFFFPGNDFKVNHVKLQGCIHPHVFFKGNFKSTEGLLLPRS